MQTKLNPHISVDCVVFGFDARQLNVLLVQREAVEGAGAGKMKLPGSPVTDDEDLDHSAYRILRELTGLDRIFLKQFAVFSSLERLQPPEDLAWLRQTSGMNVERMVTVAYYALMKITAAAPLPLSEGSQWVNVDEIPELTFDHNIIIQRAIEQLRREMLTEPLGFELLPKKFTVTQLQTLQEVVLGQDIDNRNFRKRISKLEYIIPLNESEKDVSHKPAQLYRFDQKLYQRYKRNIGSMYL